MTSFCAVLFSPLDVLDEIWDVIESVSEEFLTYSFMIKYLCKNMNQIQYFFQKIMNGNHFSSKKKLQNGYNSQTNRGIL